jgi:hypothetical protein
LLATTTNQWNFELLISASLSLSLSKYLLHFGCWFAFHSQNNVPNIERCEFVTITTAVFPQQ